MSVNYTTSLINSRLQLVQNSIDGGSINGRIRLLDNNNFVLSTIALARPSGTIAGGIYTFTGLPLLDPSAFATGTATFARVEDGDGNIIISGLVVNGASPDILLSPNANITAGQAIALTAATITGR